MGSVLTMQTNAITWPFGQVIHPPSSIPNNTKRKAKYKSVKSGKSGTIFRVLVNENQTKADKNVSKQGESVPSNSTHPSNVDTTDQVTVRHAVDSSLPCTTDAANNEHSSSDGESEAPKGHTGFPVRVVKS